MTKAELQAQIDDLRASLNGKTPDERKAIMDRIAQLAQELRTAPP